MEPNTVDPLAVFDDREDAYRVALEVYAPIASRHGYRVQVRKKCGHYGIYLVAKGRKRGVVTIKNWRL